MKPQVAENQNGVVVENLIGPDTTDCFVINRISLRAGRKKLDVPDSYGVYIITDGGGALVGEGFRRPRKKGDYFFMPCCLMGKFSLEGELVCVECW